MTAEPLRELNEKYEKLVKELNDAIDVSTKANHEQAIAKANVTKLKHLVDLVKEQIMSEKLILRAGQQL